MSNTVNFDFQEDGSNFVVCVFWGCETFLGVADSGRRVLYGTKLSFCVTGVVAAQCVRECRGKSRKLGVFRGLHGARVRHGGG